MNVRWPRALRGATAAVGIILSAGLARSATVHGTVNNGTTGKPASGVEVILLQLQGGMQPVANTKSDSSGQFTFDNANIGAQPMLVRAVYKGVNFHQPLPPGKETLAIEIFEPSADAALISVPSHVVIFQPNGDNRLLVGEEYGIKNDSKPPQAYYKVAGNFEAALPKGAMLKQIAASGPSGMPVVQAPIDKGNDKYAIAFAFRPGESEVRLSYELPYPNNKSVVKLPTSYGGGRLLVVAPPTMQVSGEGLQMAGQEQGMMIYQRESVVAGTEVAVSLSGTAPPASAADASDPSGAPGRAENVRGGDAGAIQAVPGRLDGLKWPLIGGFAVLFALGALLLARKPVAVAVAVPEEPASSAQSKPAPAKPAPATGKALNSTANAMASLDASTNNSLDALKEQLFRLELRRQAGTISEDNYAQERAKAEQVLRDLVRG